MNNPIEIPVVYIANQEDIDQAESLGLPKPSEVRVLNDVVIFTAEAVETAMCADSQNHNIKIKAEIQIGGVILPTPLTRIEVIRLMVKAGWFTFEDVVKWNNLT